MGVVLASGCPLAGDPTAEVWPHLAVEPLPMVGTGAEDGHEAAARRLARATSAEPVVLVVRREHEDAASRAVAESCAEPDAIVTVPVDLTQLGARVLTYLLTSVERVAGVACAAELGPDLARLIDARTVVAKVTALDDPAPSFGQHLRSWTRGSLFQVTSGRSRTVHTGLEPGVGATHDQALITASEGAPAALVDGARAVAAGRTATDVPPWPEPVNAATAQWAEVVLWSADEVGYLIDSRARGLFVPCRWCGHAVSEPVCVFCGADSRALAQLETFDTEEPAR